MNSNHRMMLLGGVTLVAVVVYFAFFNGKPQPEASVEVAVRPGRAQQPTPPAPRPAQPTVDQPSVEQHPAEAPAAAPATQPVAAAPSTEPAVAGDHAAPSTAPAIAAAPSTQPTTGPAIAEGAATQPTTGPAVAAAPASMPVVPEVDPNDPRPYAMRLALARASTQPAAPKTPPVAVATTTDPRTNGASRTGTTSGTTGSRTNGTNTATSGSTGSRTSSGSTPSRGSTGGTPVASAASSSKTFKMERPTAMPEEFAPVLERSLFSKDRPIVRTERPENGGNGGGFPVEPRPPRPPESRVALRGITIRDDDSFVMLENLDTGITATHHLGEKVSQGKIVEININNLVYEADDGKHQTVMIGFTFDGQQALTASAILSSGSYTPSPSPIPGAGSPNTGAPGSAVSPPSGAPSSGGSASAIIEAMRRRRAEQGGR